LRPVNFNSRRRASLITIASSANHLQASGLLDTRFFAAILLRSGFGKNPERAECGEFSDATFLIYETTVSTVKDSPQTAARFSQSQQHQERQGHAGQPPPGRTQTVDAGLIRRVMPAATPQRLKFGCAMHIKQGRDFSRVRQDGQRIVTGCLIANWLQLPAGSATRLGVVTSGKIGNAVVRSRARRLLREAFRLHQHDLAHPVDLVLVARHSITGKEFSGVEKDFLATLRRAGLLKATS
jgi:ribonuclease P protein component